MYKIFSVDDHIVEPPGVWSTRVPAKYSDRAPHVIEEDGREFWVYEDQRILTMGLNAVAGKPRDQWNMEPTRFTDMIPGCYDPKERAQDMLSQGVLASVAFPTLPRFGGMLFNSFKDKELASACVSAWNDFIIDEWCNGGPPGMFVPMIICQVWDPKLAAREIERCAAKGARALCFTENPVGDGLPSIHDTNWFWDPLFGACQDTGLAVCMHIGSSGYMPLIDPAAPFTTTISAATASGQLAMANMVISPIPLRFPKIKLVWSEGGIGWIPALLERADRQVERHEGWAGHRDIKPSEIFQRNMWCCMIEEPLGLTFYPHIGADKILAETDYPHADTPYPHTQKAYAEVFDGIPDDVVELVSHGNAESLFNWTMADESLLMSPDVSSWRVSLEADQFAAMKKRHDVGGVEAATIEVKPGDACRVMVQKAALYEECGALIGDDGVCEEGHSAA
jgi:predicted TIM-barrel fold metal-dependent hydrolase